MIASKRTRVIAIALILICYLSLTYLQWWMAPVASLFIIWLSRRAWPGRGVQIVGLSVPSDQIWRALLLFCAVTFGSYIVVPAIARFEGVVYVPVWEGKPWILSFVHTFGQTLNEEMVLGALFLRAIQSRFERARPSVISVGVALTFSLLHYMFYGLRSSGSPYYGLLSVTTLVSLFAIGVIRNNCILSTGNIGYAWAIHMGVNVIAINSSYYLAGFQAKLTEPALFNLLLGNTYLAVAMSVLMALSFMLAFLRPALIKKKRGNDQYST